MRIGFDLLRKEADYFRSKGLYKEARDLYARFAATSIDVDSDVKSAIEEQLRLIEVEMNGSQAGEPPDHSDDPGGPSRSVSGTSTLENGSDFRFELQDRAPAFACAQEETADLGSPDWVDGMADIYSLVANEAERSSTANSEGTVSPAAEPSKILPAPDPPKKNGIHRNSNLTLYLIGTAAIVAVAAYGANRFWSSPIDRQHESVQPPATIVHKKMPSLPETEAAPFSPSGRPEDPADRRFEQSDGTGEAQGPGGDPVEGSELDDNSVRPSEDFSKDATGASAMPVVDPTDTPPPPEEPDPASAIDYVLEKRRRGL